MSKAPTIIAPVYFTCPNVWNILQSSLANIIPEISLKPEKDYQVISASFDEYDNFEIAKSKKRNFMAAMDNKFPEDHWKFLTSDKENIKKLMDSIGFKFRRQGKDFIHSVVVVAVSKDGKIVRYVYGTRILPFDLTMSLVEAQKGEVGLSVKRVLSYCFSYDPTPSLPKFFINSRYIIVGKPFVRNYQIMLERLFLWLKKVEMLSD